MKTVTIPEEEYLRLKAVQEIIQDREVFEKIVKIFQDEQLLMLFRKMSGTYHPKGFVKKGGISWKRGAGKHLIGFIADDFDEPLDEFKNYM